MTIEEIFAIENADMLINELKLRQTPAPVLKTVLSQYQLEGHDINDPLLRPDKRIMGENEVTGKAELKRLEKVARIQLSIQKLIVNRAVSFLFGNPVGISTTASTEQEKTIVKAFNKILEDNKMASKNRAIARKMFACTEVAEYWYPVEDKDGHEGYGFKSTFKMKCAIFSPLDGSTLYPKFDELGNMIAFSREFITTDVEGQQMTIFETYSHNLYRRWVMDNEGWKEEASKALVIGKIPIIYGCQPQTEWADVQNLIDRLEKLLSRFADTNEYHGSPKIKVTGNVQGFSQKGEEGAIIQLENGATADYLTWNNAPESVKLEIETLLRLIFMLSQTPDVSFESVKGIGAVSGVALRLLFMDAHLKVQDKLEVFDEYLQRRTSLLKSYISFINTGLKAASETLTITTSITPYMVGDILEDVKMLIEANGGKPLISQKTSVARAALTPDGEAEYKIIEKEANEASFASLSEPTQV